MIRGRIVHGDDVLHGMPGERQLALELGVSRQTVRSAIRLLGEEGWLSRLPNGRLGVVASSCKGGKAGMARRGPVIGFARSGGGSRESGMWAYGIVRAVAGRGAVREIVFDHFGDPAIAAALDGLDGLFFLAAGARTGVPVWLEKRMRATSQCRVAILDVDASAQGLPSVSAFPARAERKLIDHLRQLGHRRIDCLNTQRPDPVIEARIEAWRRGLEEYGLEGKLHSGSRYSSVDMAYRLVGRTLKGGRASLGSALLCVTGPAAIGAMRACAEAGIAVGRDISIVAMNDEGLAPYLIPSLTCLQTPLREEILRPAVDWMIEGGEWKGSFLLEPGDIPMFVGESSGPAPGFRARPASKKRLVRPN